MSDDWRLRVELADEGTARQLADRLGRGEIAHELEDSFHARVIVSRDDREVFCYADTRDQAEAAERAIRQVASQEQWQMSTELRHWHPTAEEWEEPDAPLPHTDAERAAERTEVLEAERAESRAQGYPDFEVRVKAPSHRDAEELAQRLQAEGIPSVHRHQFVVLGAADEDTANALAERVRAEAPAGSEVTAEASVSEVVSEAPLATPFSPFAVFGGLGG
jgi:hypothetical protein